MEITFDFGKALELLNDGNNVARIGWNRKETYGKNMFLFLVPSSISKVTCAPLLGIYPKGTEINHQSHIDIKTDDGCVVPWVAPHSDLLAKDWIEV